MINSHARFWPNTIGVTSLILAIGSLVLPRPWISAQEATHPFASILPAKPSLVVSIHDFESLVSDLRSHAFWRHPELVEALALLSGEQGPFVDGFGDALVEFVDFLDDQIANGTSVRNLTVAVYPNSKNQFDIMVLGNTNLKQIEMAKAFGQLAGLVNRMTQPDADGDVGSENQEQKRRGSASRSFRIPPINSDLAGSSVASNVEDIVFSNWQPVKGVELVWFVDQGTFVFSSSQQRAEQFANRIRNPDSNDQSLESNRRFLIVESRLNQLGGAGGRINVFLTPNLLSLFARQVPREFWRVSGIENVRGVGAQIRFTNSKELDGKDLEKQPFVLMELIGCLAQPRSGIWEALSKAGTPQLPPIELADVSYVRAMHFDWLALYDEFERKYVELNGPEAWEKFLDQAKSPLKNVDVRQDLFAPMDGSSGLIVMGARDLNRFNSIIYSRFTTDDEAVAYARMKSQAKNSLTRECPMEEHVVSGRKVWFASDSSITQWHGSDKYVQGKASLADTLEHRTAFVVINSWFLEGAWSKLEHALERAPTSSGLSDRVAECVKAITTGEWTERQPFFVGFYNDELIRTFWATRLHRMGLRSAPKVTGDEALKLPLKQRLHLSADLAINAFHDTFGDFAFTVSQEPETIRVGAALFFRETEKTDR